MVVLWTVPLFINQTGALPKRVLEVKLKETRISELSNDGLVLSFLTIVENSSGRKYRLMSYEYQVLINEKEYFRQQFSVEESIEIPAEGIATLNFPLRLNYKYLQPFLQENQKQLSCRLNGQVYFQDDRKKTEKTSLNFSSYFPIFRIPEVNFLPLTVKTLTLGGAEFSFNFSLKNNNPYDLLINKISLELSLGSQVIFRGDLTGDKTLATGEAKSFSLPLILDFFEQGRELRDNLEKEAVPFTLRLQFESDSAWGRLSFSSEKSGQISKEFRSR